MTDLTSSHSDNSAIISDAPATDPMRFGFAVKVLGREGLKSNDARRWQSEPHLRVSIGFLREIFQYCADAGITMYRMSSDIAPYATHPDMPQFHGQIAECASELRELGDLARTLNLRISMHPSQFIVLNSPNPELVSKSVRDLQAGAELLDAMGMGPESVLVIHVGGTYGDHMSGCDRWVDTYHNLPENVRRRLVLENDDIRYSAADVLDIHERCGVPLIFDYQHFWCNNPEGLDLAYTVERFLRSWPDGVRPKIHYSTPNTSLREIKRKNRTTGKLETHLQQPIWTGHADFVNPFEFATFMRMVTPTENPIPFDIMLEAKSKDLALLRLRRDLPRYAPDVALYFGLAPAPPDAADDDIVEELEDAAAGVE